MFVYFLSLDFYMIHGTLKILKLNLLFSISNKQDFLEHAKLASDSFSGGQQTVGRFQKHNL